MTKKLYPTDIVKQAQSVLDAWKQISATLTFGDLTSEMLSTDVAQAGPLGESDHRPGDAINKPT